VPSPVTPDPTKLDTPTLGAWQRAHGSTGWSDEARHLFATMLAQEALRRALLDRLDNIQQFLAAGATPDQAIARLTQLITDYYTPTRHKQAA
jgi:hypothetical protein